MKIRVYLQFPEEEVDIEKIYYKTKNFDWLVLEMFKIKNLLKENQADFVLVYDNENVETFSRWALHLSDSPYLGNINNQLKQLLGNKSINLRDHNYIQQDCYFFLWSISNNFPYANLICSDAAESKLLYDSTDPIIVDFDYENKYGRDTLHIIKDAIHRYEKPLIISIPLIRGAKDFIGWHSLKYKAGFSLRDTNLFQQTKLKWEKQRVYKEIRTGFYWYNDFFHVKTNPHYEVFDKDGNHLGEADISGTLDKSKSDPNKKIRDIL